MGKIESNWIWHWIESLSSLANRPSLTCYIALHWYICTAVCYCCSCSVTHWAPMTVQRSDWKSRRKPNILPTSLKYVFAYFLIDVQSSTSHTFDNTVSHMMTGWLLYCWANSCFVISWGLMCVALCGLQDCKNNYLLCGTLNPTHILTSVTTDETLMCVTSCVSMVQSALKKVNYIN